MTNLQPTFSLANDVKSIISNRKNYVPAIKVELQATQGRIEVIDALLASVAAIGDRSVADQIEPEIKQLSEVRALLSGHKRDCQVLQDEFSRDTLNIGVSGSARVGKSTTIQKMTGLTDVQIPCGDLNPITAVRSEIDNSGRNEAEVRFRTEREFVDGYIRPHVENVNSALPAEERLTINSMAQLKASCLPTALSGNVIVGATDSLKRLHEAQKSAPSYEGLLGEAVKTVSLDDIRQYVAYPSVESENAEAAGGPVAERQHLAVSSVRIFCPFPNMEGLPIRLIDLPGLGEIGNSASSIHLTGLASMVDQVLLVIRPTKAKAFVGQEVECNIDQLGQVQPAVRQGDLVLVGVNKTAEDGDAPAENLKARFQAEINDGRADGGFEVVNYCAANAHDVSELLQTLVERMARLLPGMDQAKLDACLKSVDAEAHVHEACDRIIFAMDRILRRIPSSDRTAKDRINAICRTVINRLDNYSVELAEAADEDSDVFGLFVKCAQQIHDNVEDRINNGLFYDDPEQWVELTSGAGDYYNLSRDESRRIRYEMINAYCGLDAFYGQHLSNFKLRVLNSFLESCGMDRFFAFGPNMSADERIAKVKSELGATLRDEDLDSALDLLTSVRFDFRNNVFLQIEEPLANLANPCEEFETDEDSISKREILGGAISTRLKQATLREILVADAVEANDDILEALTDGTDRFNKYLAVSIDFFNNFLYGKDKDNFKQVVLRGLIDNYKPYVLPDADDASKSPLGLLAMSVKERAQQLSHGEVSHLTAMPKQASRAQNRAKHAQKKASKQAGIKGRVVSVTNYNVYVNYGAKENGILRICDLDGRSFRTGDQVLVAVDFVRDDGMVRLKLA